MADWAPRSSRQPRAAEPTPVLRRVLMTTDAVGGVWNYSLDLAASLAGRGVDVLLAAMGPRPRPEQSRAVARLPRVHLVHAAFALEWMRAPWAEVDAAGEWLLGLERDLDPQVVHLNQFAHGALRFRAPTVMVGHSCVLSWMRAVRGQEDPPDWRHYRRRVREGLAGANVVVAPSRTMLAWLESFYGPFDHAMVIHNARDPRGYQPRPKQPMVVSTGRVWDEAKNMMVLDRACARLPWPTFLIGSQHHPDGAEGPSPQHAHALGDMTPERAADWLARAAIYCAPARYEPFGLAVLEAALCGCALVLADIPTFRELWSDAALFVDNDDPEALAATLRRLIREHDLRASLAERARARGKTFGFDGWQGAYVRAYEAAARLRREPRHPRSTPT